MQPSPTSLNQSQGRILQMLSSYISNIRRADFLSRLNHTLHSRASSPAGGAAEDMQSYYTNRPEMRKYTLGVEMDRSLDYTLVTKDGKLVSDKDAIRSYFGVHENEKLSQCDTVDTEELLIRAANQSLLADALVALTGSEEVLLPCADDVEEKMVRLILNGPTSTNNAEENLGLILSGPILSMTSTVEKCHFTVDLQKERVGSVCMLAISVPFENRRLVLARAVMVVNFFPGRKKQLQYDMQLVKATYLPLSKPIRDAAISLAKDEENLCLQSSDEDSAAEKDATLPQLWSGDNVREKSEVSFKERMFDFFVSTLPNK